ncbi:MAG: hypothetical protein IJ343_00645 [Clostridia bacterium]|nr:hypothetical protein [Clostridia bacterium]
MDKRYRVNTVSGMIHDLELPCWWALNTRHKTTADYPTYEAAVASLKEAGVEPVLCGRCNQRRTSRKFLEHQNET